MTDEEKREEAVEKMYDAILDKDGRIMIPTEFLLDYGLHKLYDAGYRKEKEVQKETLQKLFKLINENLFDWGEWPESGLFFAIQPATIKKIIKEEFNVEVE